MEARNLVLIDRTVMILDALAAGPGTVLSLGELARRTNLPKSSVHRVLAALGMHGAVERSGRGYRLGTRLFELGEKVPRIARLRACALPFLQDLYGASNAMVHLAILDGSDVIYLERVRGHRHNPATFRLSGRQPAYCTGVGKAMLAHNSEAADAILAKPLQSRTPYTVTDPDVLRTQLNTARVAGVAVDREEHTLGVSCLAAPIVSGDRAVGAISITTTSSDIDRYGTALRAAALGIRRSFPGT